ncbi:MAG: hypothetical protein ACLPKW_22675, partial [Acetobacteraceae bacterium]
MKAYDCDPVNTSLAGVPALHAEAVELMDAEEDVLDVARADQFVLLGVHQFDRLGVQSWHPSQRRVDRVAVVRLHRAPDV